MGLILNPYGFGMTIAQQAVATSSLSTITMPTVIAGDLAILFDYTIADAGDVLPTGFSTINNLGNTTQRLRGSYKICDGSESGATVTGCNGASGNSKVLYTFRGSKAITTATRSVVNTENAGAGAPAAQTVLSGAGAAPLIIVGADGAVSAENLTGSTAFDGTQTSNDLIVGYKIHNSSPANHTVDADDGGTNNLLMSCFFECS